LGDNYKDKHNCNKNSIRKMNFNKMGNQEMVEVEIRAKKEEVLMEDEKHSAH